jgi:predicted glycogen debranching enzyme
MVHLDGETLHDRDRALSMEWLLTDGAGGYASSTVLGCGTRRYHGLWVPAIRPPVDRRVILAHLEERLLTDAGETYLSSAEYGAGFYPDGSPAAESFDLEPLPRWTSRVGDLEVEREVLLLPDGEGVCLAYRLSGRGRWTLDLGPFLALRPMHALLHRREGIRIEPLEGACGFRCLSDGMPAVFLWTDAAAAATVNPTWYYGVLRRMERERGQDHIEDLLVPGRWSVSGAGPASWYIFCSFDPPRRIDVATKRKACLKRRANLLERAGSPKDKRLARLVLAADAYLVRRRVGDEDLATVIAGYPWFGDWGRDAMTALPGLAMETGRLEVAEKVLRAFASATSEGMIPNCFAEETGDPQYNSVEGSLWFLQAVAAYVRAGGRKAFVRQPLWPAARDILARYRSGTRFGIRADADGLITAGDAETQLTWMDARSGGRPVTPRHGKAVEVNALWISGLALMREVAEWLGTEPAATSADLERARRSFVNLFWNEAAGCLYDCIRPDGRPDGSIRPNQIFAVSLPVPPLRGERARAVVRTVREKLLVPRGLRTLDPADPAYRGRYAGGPDERDAAYHQGTAWPWLLGPYVDAIFAVENAECAQREASRILEGLLDAMEEAGLGQIGEVFDGDPPHRPGGCIAQAWSVAAAIHIWRRLEAGRQAPVPPGQSPVPPRRSPARLPASRRGRGPSQGGGIL